MALPQKSQQSSSSSAKKASTKKTISSSSSSAEAQSSSSSLPELPPVDLTQPVDSLSSEQATGSSSAEWSEFLPRTGENIRELATIPLGFAANSDAAKKLAQGEMPTPWETAKGIGALGADVATLKYSPLRLAGSGIQGAGRLAGMSLGRGWLTNPRMGQAGMRVVQGATTDAIDNGMIELAQQLGSEQGLDWTQLMLATGVGGGAGAGMRYAPFFSPTNKTMQGTMSQDRDITLRSIGNVQRLLPKSDPLTGDALKEAQKMFPWVKYKNEYDAYKFSRENPNLTLSELENKSVQLAEDARKKVDDAVANLNSATRNSTRGKMWLEGASDNFDVRTARDIAPNLPPSVQDEIEEGSIKLLKDYLGEYGFELGIERGQRYLRRGKNFLHPTVSYVDALRETQKKINAARFENLSSMDPQYNVKRASYDLANAKISDDLEDLIQDGSFKGAMKEAAEAYERRSLWQEVGQATRGSDPGMQIRPYRESFPQISNATNPVHNPNAWGQAAAGAEQFLNTIEGIPEEYMPYFQDMMREGFSPEEAIRLISSGVVAPQ
jgi:hypothetical protein